MQPAPEMASSSTCNDPHREKVLGLKHKIFLSYSGDDHNFMSELYDDLVEYNYDPFFDRESLPKATPVSMWNIVQEAAASELAVFFTSEAFFSRNKNPMLELVECVKKRVRLLPLFYNISVDKIKGSVDSWCNNEWIKWPGVGVEQADEFKKAVETLLHMSGIENKEGLRPRQFRRRVVEEIQKILPPQILPDVSDICGGDRLVKVVKAMYDEHLPEYKSTQATAVLLGLYGSSGTGKSTLCKLLRNSECPVCYIQLDSFMDKTAQLERIKKVLQSLTKLSKELISKLSELDEAKKQLLEWEYEKVFFIIDNVIEDSLEEAMIYLRGGCRRFKPGTKVLITGHTEAVLHSLAKETDLKWHMAAMPDLKKEEATRILVERAGSIPVQEHLVNRCLELCRFQKGKGKGHHYHPLVLNALAQSLAHNELYSDQKEMTEWIASLESNFSYTDTAVKAKVLQHLLRSTSYNLLTDMEKQVFLDIAFYLPYEIKGAEDTIREWLDMVHKKKTKEAVRILMRRGLIDLSALRFGKMNYGTRLMHDLYHEMATLIVEEKGSKCLFLREDPALNCRNDIKRIGCYKVRLSRFILMRSFTSLKVLVVVNCEGLRTLNLEGAVCLRSLDCRFSDGEIQILGLDCCRFLVYLSLVAEDYVIPKRVLHYPLISKKGNGFHLPELRYLNLDLSAVDFNLPFDISSCCCLEQLTLTVCHECSFENPDLRGLTNLRVFNYVCSNRRENCVPIGDVVFHFGREIESIRINNCTHVSGLNLNGECIHLRELCLYKCPQVKSLEGLDQLNSLKVLHLSDIGLTAWPKLPYQIKDLEIRYCKSIPAEDAVVVLTTPGLPAIFYLVSISLLMEQLLDYGDGYMIPRERSALNCGGSLQNILQVIVESKEALDAISMLLQDHHRCFWNPNLLRLLVFLCFGERYKKMGELLSKPNIVKAIVEADQLEPFNLIVLLAVANQQFGADLESHASAIASIVKNGQVLSSEEQWDLLKLFAAVIAASNGSVAEELPQSLLDELLPASNYDLTNELQYEYFQLEFQSRPPVHIRAFYGRSPLSHVCFSARSIRILKHFRHGSNLQ